VPEDETGEINEPPGGRVIGDDFGLNRRKKFFPTAVMWKLPANSPCFSCDKN
jgi:hypothetical protein